MTQVLGKTFNSVTVMIDRVSNITFAQATTLFNTLLNISGKRKTHHCYEQVMCLLKVNPSKTLRRTSFFQEMCNFLFRIRQEEFYFYRFATFSDFLVDIDLGMILIVQVLQNNFRVNIC